MGRRVLIVDDHAGFRASARLLLEQAGYEVVGEAVDGSSALVQARSVRPDLVLLDIRLPDADGFEVATALCGEHPAQLVVLTSTREASDYGGRLAGSCAFGFVAKSELSAESLERLLAAGRPPGGTGHAGTDMS